VIQKFTVHILAFKKIISLLKIQLNRLLKITLLESTVSDFFHDTYIVFIEAYICGNLVVKHVSLLSAYQLSC
jgi:hypothetical protein